MKRTFKSIIAFLLIATTLLGASISVFAAKAEEYICELRLIYAEDYDEAKAILADTEFTDYKIYNSNLNKDSDEVGVWLAYKTTTDIDDAITDLAIMQMNGGYREGNYQAMLQQSYNEYVAMGRVYLNAISYFLDAYKKGAALAKLAYRQLNFYTVESYGIPEEDIPDFEGERLGDIFYNGIDEYELATMFLQGNSYALTNIRSLLAMGVSYNGDGKTYLDKVGESAAKMNANATVFNSAGYDDLAAIIAPTVKVFSDMFKELGTVEAELDYSDEEYTEDELKYLEYVAIAEMLRKVNYLDGKTLYQFCLEYALNESDYSSLYPLVDALNEGQVALTKVAHYYDVVLYNMTNYSEEAVDEKLSEMEETYGERPFNIYLGVDRTVYYGTFALTSDAYRADAYTESGIADAFFGSDSYMDTIITISFGAVGAGLLMGAFGITADLSYQATQRAFDAAVRALEELPDQMWYSLLNGHTAFYSCDELITTSMAMYVANNNLAIDFTSWSFHEKLVYLTQHKPFIDNGIIDLVNGDPTNNTPFVKGTDFWFNVNNVNQQFRKIHQYDSLRINAYMETTSHTGALLASGLLYVAGGAMTLYSAFRLGMTVYNYYHPDYDDVPLSMVDLVETVDGDRYVRYDVVLEAEANGDNRYTAGDLNAYEGQRWNALYYTKSYEAGQPLLANSFTVSNTSNKAKTGYATVHRFGEEICYNLNKYNFDGNTSIYLSVKQSKNNKTAVSYVPEVVGSMFGTGFLILAGGIGAALGIGGTVATYEIVKRKKSKRTTEDPT